MARHDHSSGNAGNGKAERYIRYALFILSGLLVALVIVLVGQYYALREQGHSISPIRFRWSEVLRRHAPLPVSDAGAIRSWMTFDYINKIFLLPPDYLKTTLGITDPHYPQLSISSYAKNEHLDVVTFLGQVENAVHGYTGPADVPTKSI